MKREDRQARLFGLFGRCGFCGATPAEPAPHGPHLAQLFNSTLQPAAQRLDETAPHRAHLHEWPRGERELALVDRVAVEEVELAPTGGDGVANRVAQQRHTGPNRVRHVDSPPALIEVDFAVPDE